MLLFDYGLPRAPLLSPAARRRHARCHFKQRAHDDPFINVAVQDITPGSISLGSRKPRRTPGSRLRLRDPGGISAGHGHRA